MKRPTPQVSAFARFLEAVQRELPADVQPDKVGPVWSTKHTGPNRASRRATQKKHGFPPAATNRPVRRTNP